MLAPRLYRRLGSDELDSVYAGLTPGPGGLWPAGTNPDTSMLQKGA
jgi:hypothetical protein